jgi:hypothetical protein
VQSGGTDTPSRRGEKLSEREACHMAARVAERAIACILMSAVENDLNGSSYSVRGAEARSGESNAEGVCFAAGFYGFATTVASRFGDRGCTATMLPTPGARFSAADGPEFTH